MKAVADLIYNIALGEIILKYETLCQMTNTSEYRISGTINFYATYLQFLNNRGEILRSINYDEIIEITSHYGIPLGGWFSKHFGEYQSLIVQFQLKSGISHTENIMTEIYLNEKDLKVEKSAAPSLEKTLATIYWRYRKIDKTRPDFPEYDN